ncbi:MAG: MG2 domain-containing protein, partial [Roseibacillus sp.]|nr:MG2 domain-containing protein [Roseibacillus sp.]
KENGLLFVSIEAEPKEGMESPFRKKKATQVYMQLTDIGLAWKINKDSAFIYAYSCDTGQPLANVTLDVFGEDARALQSAQTNESGVALLPRTTTQRHLRASLGHDSMIIDFDRSIPTVSMWRFPVNTEWDPQLPDKRTALLFTDRTLYRPGEEVHLKGIVRRIENNRSIFDTGKGAQLVIRDSSSRILEERDITLSDKGSFDHSFTLPARTVGYFSLELLWPEEIAAAEEMDSWHTRNAHLNSARFIHNIAVQDFRRNAFETKAGFVNSGSTDKVTLSLKASYFQGQPVAEAAVEWFYRSREAGFYPARFRDYLFCDHRAHDAYYWSHYFGYGEGSYRRSFGTRNGTATLDQDGFASLTFDLAEIDFPSPRTVSVTSEIRDQRNQTLSAKAATTVHSSDYYVGISRLDKLVRVGDEIELRAVAVNADGKPLTGDPVEFTLRIEREIHEQIKTRTASGTIAVRNEKRIETVIENQPFQINPGEAAGGGSVLPFKPEHAGNYILTLSGSDPKGRPIRTAVTQHVYGSKEYPWAYENGILIKLVPEKKRYRPGETARILVQSPIEGTALVTLEREGVHRHMLKKLTAENPVVEIPLTDEDAPNAFVSVLVIKGSQDNLRKHKEPILRLGYCELAVEVVKERLQVALKIPGNYHRPGEEVAIEGLVRDHAGNPVSGAEITVYAEDEGTLAVAGYTNPDPVGHFYAPRSLRTEAGTSLGKILSEDPEQRHTFNKGFFIGGGGAGEFDSLEGPELRKDFNPCAVWMPVLATNEEGRFKVQFTSPDTLTRYRVIAVAHHGSTHFGREVSEFTVKKPLMLEPSTPRFAHQGDRLQPKVLVQNATSYTGTWDISLKIGSITKFVEHGEKTETKSITIPADSDATVTFDLSFGETGQTDWQWTATPHSLDEAALDEKLRRELSDAVASNFAIEYPMPLLRENRFIKFEEPSAGYNMLEGLSRELLEGRGEIELEFGRSVLLEAGGALDFLLRYPYGCLEQTTS